MTKSDYINTDKRSLDVTDPSGNEMIITPSNTYTKCVCDEHCTELGHDRKNKCWGQVNMMSDATHLCDGHRQSLNNPSRYYVSETQSQNGPIQRMLGEKKELSNWGGTFTDPENIGEDYGKPRDKLREDTHYTE